jgi:hypothetical protein
LAAFSIIIIMWLFLYYTVDARVSFLWTEENEADSRVEFPESAHLRLSAVIARRAYSQSAKITMASPGRYIQQEMLYQANMGWATELEPERKRPSYPANQTFPQPKNPPLDTRP